MGRIEQNGRKRARKRNFKNAILQSVAIAGLLSLALVAPNVLTAFRKMGVQVLPNDMPKIARSRRRLIDRGLLKYEDDKLRLTSKGERALRILQIREYRRKPKKWDGRWRVLIFDIPERMKHVRDKMRRYLRDIGFVSLQQSVWIYPHDCEDLIALIKSDLKMGRNVLYMIVDELEYDAPVRKIFGLR